jgi:hypothetical protein
MTAKGCHLHTLLYKNKLWFSGPFSRVTKPVNSFAQHLEPNVITVLRPFAMEPLESRIKELIAD